jgi:hypothetical protein
METRKEGTSQDEKSLFEQSAVQDAAFELKYNLIMP